MEKKPIHVSQMTGKLKGFRAINLNPMTCSFCQAMQQQADTVCEYCYSQAMLSTFRKSCGPIFTQNAAQLSEPLEDWQIPHFMPDERIRLLAHGDMDNAVQFQNFCLIAKSSPRAHFTMWTKRKDLVAVHLKDIPDNLWLIQSSRYINKIDAPAFGFSAVFTVFSDEHFIPQGNIQHCNGKDCSSCMFCYDKPTGFIAEILKKGSKKAS